MNKSFNDGVNRIGAERFGAIAKFIYNMFFRRKLARAVKNSGNKIDDAALKAVDLVMGGK